MPPLRSDLVTPLARRFQQSLVAVHDRAIPAVAAAFAALGSWDERNIDEFAEATAPVTNRAKAAAVALAGAYYATTAGVRTLGVDPNEVPIGFDPREPFIALWSGLAHGSLFDDALTAGVNRTEAAVRNLVTSSARQTGDVVANRAGLRIAYWERIPDGGACPWCLEVAGQFYTSAENADFGHDRCGCTAQPVYVAA